MAPTLYQKWILTNYLFFLGQKPKYFVQFGPYVFVQISSACGTNAYKGMYGET